MSSVKAEIEARLQTAFSPQTLQVRDDSHKHAGHAGARPEGETHFHITIVSAAFAGLSRVERQRKLYAVLNDLMPAPIHALQLVVRTPEEA